MPEKNDEIMAILVSILFLLLGFFAIWFSKMYLRIEGDALFVSLLLVPVAIYLILSGRLSEIKAPGGLEAKFINTSKQSVEIALEVTSMEDIQVVPKGLARPQVIREKISHLDRLKPIILTLKLGKNYDRQAILQYIQGLSQFQTFRFVVLLNQENKFEAYILSQAMWQILQNRVLGKEFVGHINNGEIWELLRYPGVIKETLTPETTNIEALSEMQRRNLGALLIVDKEKNLKGVVERERIVSKLLMSLTQ